MVAAKRRNAGGPRYGSSLTVANASKHSPPARITPPTEPFAVANGSDHSIQYDALNPQVRGQRNQKQWVSADEWVDPLATANGSVGGALP